MMMYVIDPKLVFLKKLVNTNLHAKFSVSMAFGLEVVPIFLPPPPV